MRRWAYTHGGPRKKVRLSREQVEAAREAYRKGERVADIAVAYNVSHTLMREYINGDREPER